MYFKDNLFLKYIQKFIRLNFFWSYFLYYFIIIFPKYFTHLETIIINVIYSGYIC